MRVIIIYILIIFPLLLIGQEISIVSWNLKDFGKSRDDKEIEAIAQLLLKHDLVAIQEVVAKDPGGAQAVARLADALNRMGAKWDYVISDPTQGYSGHRSERYAYLWKTKHISLNKPPFLFNALSHKLIREPYYAQFKIKQHLVHCFNFHSRPNKEDPAPEVEAITEILLSNPEDNWLLLGDFNLDEYAPAFKPLYKAGYNACIHNQKTTLKRKCANGNYLNYAIDNIYIKCKSFELKQAGVIDFVTDCAQLADLRNGFSDHLGVWVEVE